MIDVCIGFDRREAVAYHVCCQSILARASEPVRFTPLVLTALPGYSEQNNDGSNAFTYSRFLVPWLMGFKGRAIYLDSDIIVRGDIAGLYRAWTPFTALQVVKHDYRTKHRIKYLGARNDDYPRKNWSSVILYDCAYPANAVLTPEYVQKHDGKHLHRFSWLHDDEIGELPREWNHLTMEYEPSPLARLLHFTLGTPCFRGYEDQEGGREWWREFSDATMPLSKSQRAKAVA